MTAKPILIVTGANKGIGKAIVSSLLQAPQSYQIYLTSRNASLGEAAVQDLSQIKSASSLCYAQLDISSDSSIQTFAKSLKAKHGDQSIEVLINNAGIATKGSRFDSEVVKETLATNYYGTKMICNELIPLIKKGGRVVNVSSMAGKLHSLKKDKLKQEFRSASQVSQVDNLMERFAEAVKNGTHSSEWPSAAYSVSKMGVTALTRALAKANPGIQINSCCPGYVNTDMTSNRGVKTTEEGARTPVFLAIGDIGHETGKFWENERIVDW